MISSLRQQASALYIPVTNLVLVARSKSLLAPSPKIKNHAFYFVAPIVGVKVYEELQHCLDERMLVEAQAVEVAMMMAKDRIDEYRFIEYEWKIQVGNEASIEDVT